MVTLPTELWWHILHLSVHDPSIFETKWDHSPDYLIFMQGWDRCYSSYNTSLPTKLSICKVSRTWREIGVKLLYEHLVLTEEDVRYPVMSKIATIFAQHANHAGYGRSTKRIDVPMEVLVEAHFPSFRRLLEHCHDIQIFVVAYPSVMASREPNELPNLYSLLQTRFSHSLRLLKLCLGIYLPLPHPLGLPNVALDSLELSTGNFLITESPPAISTVTTFSIDLYYNAYVLPTWRFPSLRHLNLEGIRKGHIPGVQTFLEIHGAGLVSFRIEYIPKDSLFTLPELLVPATNLRCLVISALPHSLPPDSRFPSITHLGLRNLRPDTSALQSIVPSRAFPGLRCIRYLNHINALRNYQSSTDMDTRMASLVALSRIWNVRFEDERGELLYLP